MGREMRVRIIDPALNEFPVSSAIQWNVPVTGSRFSSLDPRKSAGIPGHDIDKRQDVAQEGNDQC